MATLSNKPELYTRKFTRSLDVNDDDQDILVDDQFMEENFTDSFGQLLYKPGPNGWYGGNMLDQNTLMSYISGKSGPSIITQSLFRAWGNHCMLYCVII